MFFRGRYKRHSSRSPERDRAAWPKSKGADAARESHMIAVDDSELDEDDREFLEQWANALGVSIAVLIRRILQTKPTTTQTGSGVKTVLAAPLSPSNQCKCYCGGQSWSIGSTACMSGFKQRCVDSNGDGKSCGWATVKQGSDAVRCDGGENCK